MPPFEDEKLAASTLILADEISPVAAKEMGVGQFVIGSTKIRPKVDQTFPANQPMGLFLQLYNLKVDDKTHKNNATVDMQVFQGDRSIAHIVQTSERIETNRRTADVQQTVPLRPWRRENIAWRSKRPTRLPTRRSAGRRSLRLLPAENGKAAAQARH